MTVYSGTLTTITYGPHGFGDPKEYRSNVDADTGSVFFLPESGTQALFAFHGEFPTYKGDVNGFRLCISEIPISVVGTRLLLIDERAGAEIDCLDLLYGNRSFLQKGLHLPATESVNETEVRRSFACFLGFWQTTTASHVFPSITLFGAFVSHQSFLRKEKPSEYYVAGIKYYKRLASI
jgi:hypothetical protein